MYWFVEIRGIWTTFTFAFDPFCSMVVIWYISSVKLREYSIKERIKFLFHQKNLVLVHSLSWLVLACDLLLRQYLYSSTLLKTDYEVSAVAYADIVLICINQVVSIQYIPLFPQVFKAASKYQDLKLTKLEQPVGKRLVDMTAYESGVNEIKSLETVKMQ